MTPDFQAAKEELATYADLLRNTSDRWVHNKSGGVYSVVGVALEEATLTTVIVYENLDGGPMWTRPAREFLDRFQAA